MQSGYVLNRPILNQAISRIQVDYPDRRFIFDSLFTLLCSKDKLRAYQEYALFGNPENQYSIPQKILNFSKLKHLSLS